ncbi:MAG: hypothetical protein HY301_11560 [Verrucomicrobia bacterium]|nr:hypothetical protein [Verrucomicrobiota bacterium]
MKKTAQLLLLVVVVGAAAGCRSHYVLKLTNGRTVDAYSRPVIKDNAYVFKDGQGHDASIPPGRVLSIDRH